MKLQITATTKTTAMSATLARRPHSLTKFGQRHLTNRKTALSNSTDTQ